MGSPHRYPVARRGRYHVQALSDEQLERTRALIDVLPQKQGKTQYNQFLEVLELVREQRREGVGEMEQSEVSLAMQYWVGQMVEHLALGTVLTYLQNVRASERGSP